MEKEAFQKSQLCKAAERYAQYMKNTLIIIFSLIGTMLFGQNVKCADFKNGTFTLELVDPMKMKGKLIRNGNNQCEKFTEILDNKKDFFQLLNKEVCEKIEWIDDCSYRLTYDESKGELSKAQKLINSYGGILAELIKVEGNCLHYKLSVKYDGYDHWSYEIICKD